MGIPKFLDLTDEQAQAVMLPLDGRWLVTGPPGSGKTIMALYRVWTLSTAGREPVLLTHGRLLNQYCALGAQELGIEARVTTFHRWFHSFWRRIFGARPPTDGIDDWSYDWVTILTALNSRPELALEFQDLVVDEGQDLPPMFYLLCRVIAANVMVFADENQRLTERQSTLAEILSGLGSATGRHEVAVNHRNTREIALFARHFHCGSPDALPPLPGNHGQRPQLTSIPSLVECVAQLSAYSAVNPDEEIGLVLKRSDLQRWVQRRLYERNLPNVQIYVSGDEGRSKVDFDRPGIRIVNAASMKGLEFDSLFVPDLEDYEADPTSASIRMLFYVMATRARRSLHLFYRGDRVPPILADVPGYLLDQVRMP